MWCCTGSWACRLVLQKSLWYHPRRWHFTSVWPRLKNTIWPWLKVRVVEAEACRQYAVTLRGRARCHGRGRQQIPVDAAGRHLRRGIVVFFAFGLLKRSGNLRRLSAGRNSFWEYRVRKFPGEFPDFRVGILSDEFRRHGIRIASSGLSGDIGVRVQPERPSGTRRLDDVSKRVLSRRRRGPISGTRLEHRVWRQRGVRRLELWWPVVAVAASLCERPYRQSRRIHLAAARPLRRRLRLLSSGRCKDRIDGHTERRTVAVLRDRFAEWCRQQKRSGVW